MKTNEDTMIHELKSRIKLLEQQHAQSVGYMEERLLLWLGTESIRQSNSSSELINNLLERIAVLLELPFAACYDLSEQKLNLVQQYQSDPNQPQEDDELMLPQSFIDKLYEGPLILKKGTDIFSKIKFHSFQENEIKEICLYPFQSISIPFGVFVFISASQSSFSFESIENALHYLINIGVEKLEKLNLRDELKDLNKIFESKLDERTQGLQEKITSLQKELSDLKAKGKEIKVPKGPKTSNANASLDYLKKVGIEVRTPLNGILGFSELLRNVDPSSLEKDSYIDIIKSCGKSILKIVDDANELSRLEQQTLSFEPQETKLSDFITEIYDRYKKDELFQQRKELDLKLNIKVGDNVKIKADLNALSKILSNLISNAIKFTEKGTIEIGCQLTEKQKSQLPTGIMFFVKDTGVGIQKEIQKKIFDRFYKVEHEIAKMYGGLGLGLTIAKILVSKMGGTIGFDSIPGDGSDFYFKLPREVLVSESLITNGLNGIEPGYSWKKKKILIVEDDKMSLIYLQEILKLTQAEMIYVADGKAAIDMIKNDPSIDLILMDIKLPGISGFEATEIIRRFSDIPIIAQTAYAMADDYKRMIQVGCNDYISKPIKRKKLLVKIDTIFNTPNE